MTDVTDVINNTLGGVLGYQIAYVFMSLLPKREEIDAYCRQRGRQVSGIRRIWAALFDYLFVLIVFIVLYGLVIVAGLDPEDYAVFSKVSVWTLFCIASLVQVLLTQGSTLGHALCRMILVSENGGVASKWQLTARYVCLWLFTELPKLILSWLPDGGLFLVKLTLIVVSRGYFILYFFSEVFRKGHGKLPHDRISSTTYMAVEIPSEQREGV